MHNGFDNQQEKRLEYKGLQSLLGFPKVFWGRSLGSDDKKYQVFWGLSLGSGINSLHNGSGQAKLVPVLQ